MRTVCAPSKEFAGRLDVEVRARAAQIVGERVDEIGLDAPARRSCNRPVDAGEVLVDVEPAVQRRSSPIGSLASPGPCRGGPWPSTPSVTGSADPSRLPSCTPTPR